MKVGHLIVSRMASARFPGKAMAFLYGRPMIAWIVDKAKRLGGGPVVIVACDDPQDEALERLAGAMGVDCARGPQTDFSAQYLLACQRHGLTHYLEWSGDSPFACEQIAARIMAAIRERPGVWHYTGAPYPSGATGIAVPGHDVVHIHASIAAANTPEALEEKAKGWPWYHLPAALPAVRGETVEVNIGDLFDMPRSLFSMCIDYPVQLDFFNRICRHVGHFPTWQEIEQAHREMTTLGGEICAT